MTTAYFLSGTQYWRYDVAKDRTDGGYPKAIAAGWSGLTGAGFDAAADTALDLGKGNVYVFKGSTYVRINQTSRTLDGGPRPVAGNWPGLGEVGFDHDLDAALNLGDGFAYFFRGDQCLQYDIGGDHASDGYPVPIADEWPGLADAGFDVDLDAALNLGNGYAYFFKGDQYLRYDLGAGRADSGATPVAGNWPGLDAAMPLDAAWLKIEAGSSTPTPTGKLGPGDHVWYWNGKVSRTRAIPNQAWFGTVDGSTDYGGNGKDIYNFVVHANGEIRRGRPQMRNFEGSQAWLNNNPGNITSSPNFSGVGEYPGKVNWHNFMIFPTEAAGMAAIGTLLRTQTYAVLSIADALKKYAPASDGNDPAGYAAKVAQAAGVPVTTPLGDLTDEQLEHMKTQIRVIEGWVPGVVLAPESPDLPEAVRSLL